MKRTIILISMLCLTAARAQYCELIGYEIWGQDAEPRGAFLGVISQSTIYQYSIMNELGPNGSSTGANSIFNQFGKFGDDFSNTSAWNKLATKPPVIWEYRAATDTYYKIGYLSVSSLVTPRYGPGSLISVLAFGNCDGCTPIVIYDTLKISIRDTVVKRDTIRTTDTLKVTVHDTVKVKDCPASIRNAATPKPSGYLPAFTVSGRAVGECRN